MYFVGASLMTTTNYVFMVKNNAFFIPISTGTMGTKTNKTQHSLIITEDLLVYLLHQNGSFDFDYTYLCKYLLQCH